MGYFQMLKGKYIFWRRNKKKKGTSFESCDSCLPLALSDDASAIISQSLSPRDISNISLCSRSPGTLAVSENVWLTQCELLGIVPLSDLLEWRKGVSSYQVLCRFLLDVKNLIGIWVNKNPEKGNVVYVVPGFVSVVGCRIIPQEVNLLGIEHGHILWTPVFEVIGDFDGSTKFFLHGRDGDCDYLYPGLVKSIDKNCNVLLLEVETTGTKKSSQMNICKSSSHLSFTESDDELPRSKGISGSDVSTIPFSQLSSEDRKGLFKDVTTKMRFKVPDGPLFPRLGDEKTDIERDMVLLLVRRAVLLQKHKHGDLLADDDSDSEVEPNLTEKTSSPKSPFISSDTLRLTFHASEENLSYYKSFPKGDDNSLFALYKFPSVNPRQHQEFGGLWGATFSWPPENVSFNPLFLLVLSYKESKKKRVLRAMNILQGHVDYPNGSVIFSVNIDQPSLEKFPWDIGADSLPVTVEDSFKGEGIADGYGFRYPGSKPGSLYVIQNGFLAFVWKESNDVLTLRRLDLHKLLKKGKRSRPLPPTQNFSYMSRSYGNVYS